MNPNEKITWNNDEDAFFKKIYDYLLCQNLILKNKLIILSNENLEIKTEFEALSNENFNIKKQLNILSDDLNSIKKDIKLKEEKIKFLNDLLDQRNGDYYDVRYLLPKDLGRKWVYKKMTNKELDLSNPKDLNEKINWLIVFYYGVKEGKLTDKHLVKDYILEKNIKDLHVPKTYKVYKNAEDIDLEDLPEKFVLKCNHISGSIFICTNKKNFDLNTAKKVLNNQLKRKYSLLTLEYHYEYINPCIIAEEYLDDNEHIRPLDYKFYTMNGKVENILLCSNRDDGLKLDDYDCEWNKRDYTYKKFQSNISFKKPKNLGRMVEIAEELGNNHVFVRVDLYEINGKIYFGELTFTPANGYLEYYKQETLDLLGSKLILPKIN